MFDFSGTMSRGDYAFAASWRVALFAVIASVLPYLWALILQFSDCAAVVGECARAKVRIAFYVNPVIYTAFLASMTATTIRRTRDLGLPGNAGFVVMALLLADWQFGVALGGPWSAWWAVGMRIVPYCMLAGLACVVFLSLVEAPDETDGEPAERFGRPGRIAFWLTCFAALGGLLQFALITLPMPGGRGLAGEIIFAAMLINSISVSGIVVLFGLLGFVIWRDYYLRAGTLRSPGAPRTAAHHGAPRAAFGQRRR